jgi:hypothetical protein
MAGGLELKGFRANRPDKAEKVPGGQTTAAERYR